MITFISMKRNLYIIIMFSLIFSLTLYYEDILEAVVANKQKELELWKQYVPLKQLYGIIEYGGALERGVPSFKSVFNGSSTIKVIAEFVRKRPLGGWIDKESQDTECGC